MSKFQFNLGDNVFFHSSCDCCSPSPPRPSSWQYVADLVNMQTPTYRAKILKELRP